VGYIHAAGLLKRDDCTPELEQRAWEFYRTNPIVALSQDRTQLIVRVPKAAGFSQLKLISAIGPTSAPPQAYKEDSWVTGGIEHLAVAAGGRDRLAMDPERNGLEFQLGGLIH